MAVYKDLRFFRKITMNYCDISSLLDNILPVAVAGRLWDSWCSIFIPRQFRTWESKNLFTCGKYCLLHFGQYWQFFSSAAETDVEALVGVAVDTENVNNISFFPWNQFSRKLFVKMNSRFFLQQIFFLTYFRENAFTWGWGVCYGDLTFGDMSCINASNNQ